MLSNGGQRIEHHEHGFKDTVRDGVEGFRIPVLMPTSGMGAVLALRHALEVDTYDMYCGHTCSLVAVDVAATAHARCMTGSRSMASTKVFGLA